jgi:lysophospholipase L1-like esterase
MAGMCPRRGLRLSALALGVSVGLAACGGGSPASPTPPPAQLTLVCPPAQTAVSFQNQPVTVSWPAPSAQGGTPPVQTTCTPASGSAFTPGTSTVGCTATGAGAGQTASCAFAVVITRPPQISVTRFMAYGDSITFGIKSDPSGFLTFSEPEPSYSYPNQLRLLLGARYPDQALTVANEGEPGEPIDAGIARLPSELALNVPEVLLLLHGANDLIRDPSRETAEYIAARLRDMIRLARARPPSPVVLLATFPPQFVGVPPHRGAGAPFVPELNQRIAAVAQSEGATLVDLYGALSTDTKRYIGVDGLHPTEAGFALMAQTFAVAVQGRFEVKTAGADGRAAPSGR